MRPSALAVIMSLGFAATFTIVLGEAATGCIFRTADDCPSVLGYGCTTSAGGTGGTGSGGATSSTTTGTGTGGATPECTDASTCTGDIPPGPCASFGTKTCDHGKCGVAYTMGDAPSQKYGDCKKTVCGADGTTTVVSDDMDVYDDGNPCTKEICTNGDFMQTKLTGMACSVSGASGVCVADAVYASIITCSECDPSVIPTTCMGGAVCLAGKCVPQHCNDKAKDFGETDVDCGGSTSGCPKCPMDSACASDGDCASGVCGGGKCATSSCSDTIQNQDETDTDCGGAICSKRCGDGKKCVVGSDCKSGVCRPSSTPDMPNTCQTPTCTDGVQNGDETGVDCGGAASACPACATP